MQNVAKGVSMLHKSFMFARRKAIGEQRCLCRHNKASAASNKKHSNGLSWHSSMKLIFCERTISVLTVQTVDKAAIQPLSWMASLATIRKSVLCLAQCGTERASVLHCLISECHMFQFCMNPPAVLHHTTCVGPSIHLSLWIYQDACMFITVVNFD